LSACHRIFTDVSAGCSPNPASYDETALRRNELSSAVTSGVNEIYDESPNVNSMSDDKSTTTERQKTEERERERERKRREEEKRK
jgi:hypothetical protein